MANSLPDRIQKALENQNKAADITVLSSLISVQDELGYLPEESIPLVAEFTSSSVNDVWGVATFYTHFRLEPPGEKLIEVCWGPSCHLRGAPEVMQAIQQEIGLDKEGTTPDHKYTFKRVTCAAACSQAPVITVNEELYGLLTADSVRELLKNLNGRKGV